MGRPVSVVISIGDRFDRLEVIAAPVSSSKGRKVLCRCDCGTKKDLWVHELARGSHSSCGCKHLDGSLRRTHGAFGTPAYVSWYQMLQRCNNPNHKDYSNYGGRGIKACNRWLKFENFSEDMGERDLNLTLERKDVNKWYSKANCIWATRKEQNRNTRKTIVILYNGVSKPLWSWCEELGLNPPKMRQRYHAGWSGEDMFETP